MHMTNMRNGYTGIQFLGTGEGAFFIFFIIAKEDILYSFKVMSCFQDI